MVRCAVAMDDSAVLVVIFSVLVARSLVIL